MAKIERPGTKGKGMPIGKKPVTIKKGGPRYNTSTGGGHSSTPANTQRRSGR